MENAKIFFEDVIKTEEAKKLITSYEPPNTHEETVQAYAKIAKDLDIDLSEAEINAYFDKKLTDCTASGELDDDEMYHFSGGQETSCFNSYIDRENCWSNDGCDYYMNIYSTYNCSWSTKGACAAFNVDEDRNKTPGNPIKFA